MPVQDELRRRIDALCDQLAALQGLVDGDPRAVETLRVCRDAVGALVAEQTEALAALSMTDELTGLLNRRGFQLRAGQVLAAVRRAGGWALLLFADLDGLKAINDRQGHPAGDEALREVAGALRETFRGGDLVARLGGDEFAALAHFHRGGRPGRAVSRRLRAALRRRGERAGRAQPLRLSLGLLVLGEGAEASLDAELEALLARADGRMYARKRARPRGAQN